MTRNNLSRFSIVATAASLAFAMGASAQDLKSLITYQIVETAENGQEILVERTTVRPGDVIQYTVAHSNETEMELAGLVINAPVPEGVTISLGSQTSSHDALFNIQADLNPEAPGLEWSSLPAFRTVISADGNERKEPLPDEAIAAVRWILETTLPSGETALNTYRLVVE